MSVTKRAPGLILGLIFSLLAVFPVQAAPADLAGAKHHVEALGRNALGSLQAPQLSEAGREAALASVLEQGVAVDLIGRFVLGRHWRAATPVERAEYQALFREFVVKSYAGYLQGLTGTTFEITQAVAVGEQDVLVSTRIDRAVGNAIQAGWRVRKIEGNYKIIDVVVEGVSLAAAQRQDFSSVVGREGMVGLLDILKSKTRPLTTAAR